MIRVQERRPSIELAVAWRLKSGLMSLALASVSSSALRGTRFNAARANGVVRVTFGHLVAPDLRF
jgi:hypothetical protein